MIKYLRDKITGRSTVFSPADDLPYDDHISSIKKTHSQNSLNDVMSISLNSNLNNDQIISQVEKLTAAGGGGRLTSSSSPIIIPKKPIRSNASPQSSSSYTSVGDQMSSLGETSLQSHRELDDAGYTLLPMQQLEHSAARDRISVKNKRRRQPIKEKLSTLRETDDNQTDLFSSTSDDEQAIVVPQIEVKIQQQPSDLDTERSQLRAPIRPRDHSADNILSTTPMVPKHISSVQRSISFKRPQEINEKKFINRPIFKIEKNNEDEENKKSAEEHIYDNLDLFKHHQINTKSDLTLNDNQSSTNNIIKTRERSLTRLRPVTMYIPPDNEKQTTNEFENVFNQLKKRTSIKKVQPKEEIKSVPDEPVQSPVQSVPVEETPIILITESEPIVPVVISTNKIIETPSVSQPPNRRKTVSGVHLAGNNTVSVDDNKPTPSWIDLAKQRQNKFQSVAIEKTPREEPEQTAPIEPVPDEPVQSFPVKETPIILITENEPIIPFVISTNKIIETPSILQPPNRRKTVVGAHLAGNNKVSADDNKPTPSWIDLAKQRQNKFQSVAVEKPPHKEPEQTAPIEPVIESKKQVIIPPNVAIIKENTSEDTRSNKKLVFEPIVTRRPSPPINTHAVERDSIRALKVGNPNRINNLIQFFDK